MVLTSNVSLFPGGQVVPYPSIFCIHAPWGGVLLNRYFIPYHLHYARECGFKLGVYMYKYFIFRMSVISLVGRSVFPLVDVVFYTWLRLVIICSGLDTPTTGENGLYAHASQPHASICTYS